MISNIVLQFYNLIFFKNTTLAFDEIEIKVLTFWSLLCSNYSTVSKLDDGIHARLGRSQSKETQKYQTLHDDLFPTGTKAKALSDWMTETQDY